ncbi:hypothetical protein BDV12DRAFT_188808 [Aspergillus spectabilis]
MFTLPATMWDFVLCFDGTGNKFRGDSSDSNVLKIFRMLDRNGSNQFHYYQPGIGTYVTSASLEHNGCIQKLKSAYTKAKAAAIGSTFADHVMGAINRIYFFGFSRGAYVARFLAEMLDRIGLLEAGNEELISFAWKTFAKWQQRSSGSKDEEARKEDLERHMFAFRETFCQPITQIRFLGLFDTVNSAPRFGNAWMRRSRFPYTARTSAKVIRHAVSIDEHRAKFRQDLMSEVKPGLEPGHSRLHSKSQEPQNEELARNPDDSRKISPSELYRPVHRAPQLGTDSQNVKRGPESAVSREGHCATSGSHSPVFARQSSIRSVSTSCSDGGEVSTKQDIEEVWFPGCHADIGGGWEMVHNAQQSGLRFDPVKLEKFDCLTCDQTARLQRVNNPENSYNQLGPVGQEEKSTGESASGPRIGEILRRSSTDGQIHDCLRFGKGTSGISVLSWKMMEYLPFRRMDLQENGLWKPIRWPLPCGEVRDIPDDAKIHVSAILRLHSNSEYRPRNLIIGGGGRGKRQAPKEYGTGEWIVAGYEACPLKKTYIRKPEPTKALRSH